MGTRAKNKVGWHGSKGGVGSIQNGQNLGTGSQVFAGKSSPSILDFRTLKGNDGITLTQSANEIEISSGAVVGNIVPVIETLPAGEGNLPSSPLNNETFYAAGITWGTGVANCIQIYVETIGAIPTQIDGAIYDGAGNLLASLATPYTVDKTGLIDIELDSEISFSIGDKLWLAIAGDSTGNSTFKAENNATNSSSWNRFVSPQYPIPAGNLPAGTTTAKRFWMRLINSSTLEGQMLIFGNEVTIFGLNATMNP